MRSPLPRLRPNGHAPTPGRVFVINGMCQQPRFRLGWEDPSPGDTCVIYLGASQFGAPPPAVPGLEDDDGDPYFILRRYFDGQQAAVTLRVEWEGVFTILANDDDSAETVFGEVIEPGEPDEVQRQWSEEPATLRMFAELLFLE